MTKPRIGFIGLGVMGAPMAGHIARAGYDLSVHDIDRAAAKKVAAGHPGVIVKDSPKAVALDSDIVITMLPSGEYVRQVALGPNGLIEGFREGALLLDTSSSEPWLTLEIAGSLAGIGVAMVDAPVSGALAGARAAELVFMVGGSEEAVARVRPLFDILGKQVFHLGPVGSGHTMKCLNNTITAMTFMATAEGLAIGKKLGMDPNVMTDVLNVCTGMSWISQTQFKQRITNRKFDDAFKLELMVKDIGIALELATREKMPVPLSGLGHHLWKAADRHAGPGRSISDMVRWVENMTGVEISPSIKK